MKLQFGQASAAADPGRANSAPPWCRGILGPAKRAGRFAAEPKKSFIYNKISLGAESNEPTEPNDPNQAKPFRKIPNEPINPLKTHKSFGFVPSFPNPDRRALPHQPPNLVHLLIRHRDTPLRPVARDPYPVPQTVDHDVPTGVHPRLPRARYVRRI